MNDPRLARLARSSRSPSPGARAWAALLVALAACAPLAACGDSDPPIDEADAADAAPPTDDATPPRDTSPPTDASPPDGGRDGSTDATADGARDATADARDAAPGTCATDDDCEGRCVGGTCAAPTHTDGKVSPSLGETDIDCGGPTAPTKCGEAKSCALDRDCSTAVCSTGKKCVVGASCRGGPNGPSGVDTCGTGEPGTAGAVVESCCRSLPLPTRTTRRLDRYEITGGRVRAFLDGLAAANGGVANVRAYALAYAAANPTSQLAEVLNGYPGLLDVLPDRAGPSARFPMPVHLGPSPLDPINALDGCFVGDGGYGHATYWQPSTHIKPYGIGYVDGTGFADGVRKYSREELDKKPVNCMMPLLLASFCAWDGGELARTDDFREVWGRRPEVIGATTVYIPWATLLNVGQFNWRNGHGTTCNPAWPGCVNPQRYFYVFPTIRPDGQGHLPADDDTPAIAAPGRFPLDVTAIKSAGGDGWYDIGGNLMEAAWPTSQGAINPGASQVTDVCDVTAGPGFGESPCVRRGNNGVLRYAGALPHVALVGSSFEGHSRRSERYLSATAANEGLIAAGDLKPATFQYGKVGARCAR